MRRREARNVDRRTRETQRSVDQEINAKLCSTDDRRRRRTRNRNARRGEGNDERARPLDEGQHGLRPSGGGGIDRDPCRDRLIEINAVVESRAGHDVPLQPRDRLKARVFGSNRERIRLDEDQTAIQTDRRLARPGHPIRIDQRRVQRYP